MLLNARRLDDVQLIFLAMEDITVRKHAEQRLAQQVQERTVALEQALAERQQLEREVVRVQHLALLGRLAASERQQPCRFGRGERAVSADRRSSVA
jgi:hypothetical protein